MPGVVVAAFALVLVLVAGMAGAVWQEARGPGGIASIGRLVSSWRAIPAAEASIGAAVANQSALNDVLSAASQPDSVREADFVRENVALLARRMGALQAQVVALESMNQRLIGLAGQRDAPFQSASSEGLGALAAAATTVAATANVPAGLAALARVGDLVPDEGISLLATPTAQDLGRQLDVMQADLARRSDMLAALDTRLTQRSGAELRWPTTLPVTDYPYLSSSYGWRRHPITGRRAMHEGLDFAAPAGTRISAAAGGVVTEARYVNGYGNLVEIDHGDGLMTRYAHASRLYVKQGEVVKPGQRVASVGSSGQSTGPHLHFEIRLAGQPLDPRLFLPRVLPTGGTFASAGQDASQHGPS